MNAFLFTATLTFNSKTCSPITTKILAGDEVV
jgi:hypothetical protein